MEIHQKMSVPNYLKLKTMVKRSMDQKHRLRLFDAGHGRIETGAVVKNRKGMSGVEGGKSTCYQWKGKGQCSERRRMQFPPRDSKIVRKNQNTLPPHLLRQPYHEVQVCRGREVSDANVTMGPFFDNRANIVRKVPARERLVNIGIRPSANALKMKRVLSLETSVCFRMTRLMNNQRKSWARATSTKEENATTRMLWPLWKVFHNWVVHHKIRMHSFLKAQSLRETRCRKSLKPIQRVRFTKSTLRHASIPEKKRPSLGKYKCQSSSSAKSLRYEIPWRDWTTSAMCPKQGFDSCQQHKLNTNKDFACGGMGTLGCVNGWREREFVVDSGESMHMVSKKDFNSVEMETMRASRSPTTVMTANGEVQTREEATVFVKQLDLFVKVVLLEETPAVLSFFLENSTRIMGIHTTGPAVREPHLIRNGKRIWLKYFELCTICGSWFISEFFLNCVFTIIFITGFRIWCQQIHWKSRTRKKWKYEWKASGRDPLHESTETESKK